METTVTTTTPADLWLQATGEEPAKELSQIPPQMAADLVQRFVPFAQQVAELAALAAEVEVTEEDDTAGMTEARRLRLAMKAVRVEADKVRKEEKQYALVVGKSVDFLGRSIRERAELVEARLEESEKFAERREAERKEARRLERVEALLPYVDDVSDFDLADMTDAAFDKLLAAMKANHEAAVKAQAEAEAERKRQEEAERAEQERIRAENERLRAENAEKEAEAARLAAELKAKQEAEAAAAREAEAAQREAASTDDVDKVRTLYRQIRAIEVPEMQNVYGGIGRMVREELDRLLVKIEEQMRRAG